MSTELEFYGNLVEENGKTIKENNLNKEHKIPIGSLVEIDDVCRLYVVNYSRDCDGTPLYNLCHNKDDITQDDPKFRNFDWVGGFGEESLMIIKNKSNDESIVN